MRINSNLNFISDPILHYKLDPGEPGLAAPKHASESIAAVATHEATNIRRFRKEAIEKGGYVVDSFIGLNLQFRGSFLAAVSGKSKALVIIPADSVTTGHVDNSLSQINRNQANKDTIFSDTITGQNSIMEDNTQNNNTSSIDNSIDNMQTDINELTIDSEIQKSEEKKEQILQKIKSEEENTDNISNVHLKEELHKLQAKIELLKAKKELQKQASLLNFMGNAQMDLPARLILSKYTNNNKFNGSAFDLVV